MHWPHAVDLILSEEAVLAQRSALVVEAFKLWNLAEFEYKQFCIQFTVDSQASREFIVRVGVR